QAEDGIRYDLVTGVQTCALPILALLGMGPALQDQLGELGGAWTDRRRLTTDPLDGPLGIAPMRTRHVFGDRGVPATTGATQVDEIGRASCRERGETRVRGRA